MLQKQKDQCHKCNLAYPPTYLPSANLPVTSLTFSLPTYLLRGLYRGRGPLARFANETKGGSRIKNIKILFSGIMKIRVLEKSKIVKG